MRNHGIMRKLGSCMFSRWQCYLELRLLALALSVLIQLNAVVYYISFHLLEAKMLIILGHPSPVKLAKSAIELPVMQSRCTSSPVNVRKPF